VITVTKPPHVPVVIAGAGPTGTTAGTMLAQRSIARLLTSRAPAAEGGEDTKRSSPAR
jgi:2-polyprenyl-6-methoxyphenol hydroxylase-like FAD-dependent oxidoreductase